MTNTGKRKTAAELDDALRLLDHELSGLQLNQPLEIRAIGGYALLKHGVRKGEHAYTVDIDTVSRDYGAAIEQAIRKVAEQLDLEPGWLNNDNVLDNDPEQVEMMLDAEWIPQAMDLRNIAVSIASIPTLTRAKIMAAEDAEFSGRQRDADDLRALLDHQGITSVKGFDNRYPDPFQEYPAAHDVVRLHLGGEAAPQPARRRFPELEDIDLDAYGLDLDDVDDGYRYEFHER